MEHWRSRHLGAEPEPPGSLRTVYLIRLATAACDCLDYFMDVGKNGTDEPVCPGAHEDAMGKTMDLSPPPTRRESVRPTALRVPHFRKRSLVNGLPLGWFLTATRTAIAVDIT